jgi:metal-responsive CopG/Arc/MetJ family transcriptional regulator
MKRLNVYLPEELHTRLKVHCALNKTDMSEVIRRLLEEYLAREERKSRK